jgi:hypothetical protein
MNRIKLLFTNNYLYLLLLFAIVSCTKTSDVEINPQDSYKYFPIEVGDYNIFQKVTYSYAVGQKVKIDSVLVKETVASKTISNSDTYFVIERQAKGLNDLFFKPEAVFQVITNPKQVIKGERNVYTILLHYPVYLEAKWNINEINGQDEKEAEIVSYDKLPPKLITNKNIIKVLTDSTNNLIDFKVGCNIFAKDFGLIYQENTYIDYCQDSDPNPVTSCVGKFIMESGKREFITLLEHNKKQ